MSRGVLYKWKNQLMGLETPASMKPNNDLPPDPERSSSSGKSNRFNAAFGNYSLNTTIH
ncbi:hypothetical protein IWX87_003553 [Polaromonas sp. CG_9.7]|nr:hypothetical protein [Polaromonas sp. CG_9.7]MBG6115784.1 hypothetical protein [Polaromonas sp. CG_9.2]